MMKAMGLLMGCCKLNNLLECFDALVMCLCSPLLTSEVSQFQMKIHNQNLHNAEYDLETNSEVFEKNDAGIRESSQSRIFFMHRADEIIHRIRQESKVGGCVLNSTYCPHLVCLKILKKTFNHNTIL